jgi:hypothetical protein
LAGWLLGWLAGWFTFSGELLPKKIKKNVRIWETREFQPATTSRRNNNEPKGQLTTTTSLQLPIFRLETSLQGINVEILKKESKGIINIRIDSIAGRIFIYIHAVWGWRHHSKSRMNCYNVNVLVTLEFASPKLII